MPRVASLLGEGDGELPCGGEKPRKIGTTRGERRGAGEDSAGGADEGRPEARKGEGDGGGKGEGEGEGEEESENPPNSGEPERSSYYCYCCYCYCCCSTAARAAVARRSLLRERRTIRYTRAGRDSNSRGARGRRITRIKVRRIGAR